MSENSVGNDSTSFTFSRAEIRLFADLYGSGDAARNLLEQIGFSRASQPSSQGLSAEIFWHEVMNKLAAGVVSNPRSRLFARALQDYPDSRRLARAAGLTVGGAKPRRERVRPPNTGSRNGRVSPGGPIVSPYSDAPSSTDLIGIDADVELLAMLISARATVPPLSIALLGDWGAGKSTFMLQLRARIDYWVEQYSGHDDSEFVGRVLQIPFNAWTYSDDHVWTGLVDKLFRELATDAADVDLAAMSTDGMIAEVTRLRGDLDRARSREGRLTADLETIGRVKRAQGSFARFVAPSYLAAVGRSLARDVWSDFRSSWQVLLQVAATVLVAAVALRAGGPLLSRVLSGLIVEIAPLVLSAVLLVWPAVKAYQAASALMKRLHAQLRQTRDKAQCEADDLQERLILIDAAARLSAFLKDRGDSDAYASYRGLVGKVRDDLSLLDERLRDARKQWAEHRAARSQDAQERPADDEEPRRPLDKIVLYVDDLDRCAPDKVVEVLAAIHLLLALPLFIVVVAVDARWLKHALTQHQRDMFALLDGAKSGEEGFVSPVDYLDKIFQIPFALPPMDESARRYLGNLLLREDGAVRGTVPTSGPGTPSVPASGREPGDQPVFPRDRPGPATLRISQREKEFLPLLHPLVRSPRAGKKLVNLYRLVRMSVSEEEVDEYLGADGEQGDYQAVAVLVAALVFHEIQANQLFRMVADVPGQLDIVTVMEPAAAGESRSYQLNELLWVETEELRHELVSVIEGIRAQQVPVLGGLGTYQRWWPAVARFSFVGSGLV